MTHNDTVRHIKDKPHSFEFGRAGRRVKLYFNDLVHLRDMIEAMIKWGMVAEEDAYLIDSNSVEGGDNDGRKETN